MNKHKKLLIAAALVFSLSMVLYMLHTAYSLKVRYITMEFENLPKSFNNTKIAIASDIHVGLFISEKRVEIMSQAIMTNKPDIITFLGDYIYSAPRWFKYYNKINSQKLQNGVSSLSAPLGMYGVMGNHDNWEGRFDVSNALHSVGFKMIDNNIVYITNSSKDYISIGGVGDYLTDNVDFEAATIGVGTNDFHMILSHEPYMPLKEAEEGGYTKFIDFFISGHTHGRQINVLPMSFIEKVNSERSYPRFISYGIMNYGNTKVYVTSGVGLVLLPYRLFAYPEIVIVTLKSKQ